MWVPRHYIVGAPARDSVAGNPSPSVNGKVTYVMKGHAMKMKPFEWFALVAFLVLFSKGITRADPVNVQCPESLDVAQTATAIGDWQVYGSTTTHTFSRLHIYNGHPSGKVLLDPDNADEQPVNYRWTLGDAGNTLWVECTYHGATTRLIRQLPKGLHSCQSQKVEKTMALTCE